MFLKQLKPLQVEENTPKRLQIQIFDTTLGFVFFVLGGVSLLATAMNLQKGEVFNGIGAMILAVLFLLVPLFFMGVKRISIDRDLDTLSITNRAYFRKMKEERRQSEIKDIVLVDQTTGTSGPKELEIGEEYVAVRNAYYTVEAKFSDKESTVILSGSGSSIYQAGQILMSWWESVPNEGEEAVE